jgi:uncharacterized protein
METSVYVFHAGLATFQWFNYTVSMLILIIAGILVLLGAAVYGAGIYTGRKVVHYVRYSLEYTRNWLTEKYPRDLEVLELFQEDFSLTSYFGYQLSGAFIRGSTPRTIIFCHGVSWTRHGMLKYMRDFIDRRWNIVVYDHRGHGMSGGRDPSFGFYEKVDLKVVFDWAGAEFGAQELVGVYGESMGGAIALQFAPLEPRLDFVIADCAYASFSDAVQNRMKPYPVPGVLSPLLVKISKRYIRREGLFSLDEITPEDDIMKTAVPMMFFHGAADSNIPVEHSVRMYRKRKDTYLTRLCVVDRAEHAQAIRVDENTYRKELCDFLDWVEKQKEAPFR